ncbi:MAG TPA: 50S ribosomal protein L18 [bacterium]
MPKLASRTKRLDKRKFRIRQKIQGMPDKPRLSVFRSAKHIYVQAIDDLAGKTLASASTKDKELKPGISGYTGNATAATAVGKAIAQRLKKIGVEKAVFDRGGNRYHGRVKAVADGAREAGLKI